MVLTAGAKTLKGVLSLIAQSMNQTTNGVNREKHSEISDDILQN
jgi:hypothetical protein